jgi:hypothetical protein
MILPTKDGDGVMFSDGDSVKLTGSGVMFIMVGMGVGRVWPLGLGVLSSLGLGVIGYRSEWVIDSLVRNVE